MSRPSSSTPIGWDRLGGSRSTRKSCLTGSYGLTKLAKIAASSKMSNTAVPATPEIERLNRRRAATQGEADGRYVSRPDGAAAAARSIVAMLAVPDARVEHR